MEGGALSAGLVARWQLSIGTPSGFENSDS